MRRRLRKVPGEKTKLRDLAKLDERVDEIDELPPDLLIRRPRALRQAETTVDHTKPRKGRSR